jgi:hypothetical protein
MAPGYNRKSEFSLLQFILAVVVFTVAHGRHAYTSLHKPHYSDTSWQRWGKIFHDAWPGAPSAVTYMAILANPDTRDLEQTTLVNVWSTLAWMLVLNWLQVYIFEMWYAAPNQARKEGWYRLAWNLLRPVGSQVSWVLVYVVTPPDNQSAIVVFGLLAFIGLMLCFRNPEQVLEGTLMLTFFQFLSTIVYVMWYEYQIMNVHPSKAVPADCALLLFLVPFLLWLCWRFSEQRRVIYNIVSHPICVLVVYSMVTMYGIKFTTPRVTYLMTPTVVFKDNLCPHYADQIAEHMQQELTLKKVTMTEDEWRNWNIPTEANHLCGYNHPCVENENKWNMNGVAGAFMSHYMSYQLPEKGSDCKTDAYVYFTKQKTKDSHYKWYYDCKANHEAYMARWGIILAWLIFICTQQRSDFEAHDLQQWLDKGGPWWKRIWHEVFPWLELMTEDAAGIKFNPSHNDQQHLPGDGICAYKSKIGRNKGERCTRKADPNNSKGYCGATHKYT